MGLRIIRIISNFLPGKKIAISSLMDLEQYRITASGKPDHNNARIP